MGKPPEPSKTFLDYLPGALADLIDMLEGKGAHADHTQKQVGRCVYCSCGKQAQGRLHTRRR